MGLMKDRGLRPDESGYAFRPTSSGSMARNDKLREIWLIPNFIA